MFLLGFVTCVLILLLIAGAVAMADAFAAPAGFLWFAVTAMLVATLVVGACRETVGEEKWKEIVSGK